MYEISSSFCGVGHGCGRRVLSKYGLASAAGVLLPEGKCLALKRLVQVFINDEWLFFFLISGMKPICEMERRVARLIEFPHQRRWM
jgi:hypothetical protein